MDEREYQTPFTARYASKEMSYFFSPYFKYLTWRRLWIALAKGQKNLGLAISDEQIQSMETICENIDLEKAEDYEKKLRHDVMAHIHAFGDQCPQAKGIIHLGATSCFVTDNGDLIQIREGLKLISQKIVVILRHLSHFGMKYADYATLSYTHFQSAQPTTIGKRACIWAQDFLMDLHEAEHVLDNLRFLGAKGASGTQASFLSLFEGEHKKVHQLEEFIAKQLDFPKIFLISGQTYTRKQDICIMHVLSGLASSAHKFATDIRLLCHLKEIEEPFAEKQIGSSAMPYKRNPMRSERICGLSRFLLSLQENPLYTHANQWFERTLDDSSNRRLYLPEAFLTADAVLNLIGNVVKGLIVHPRMIEKHLKEELPFLITENILMSAVKKGKDRQVIHERLRIHSLEAGKRIKEEGLPNDLLERIEKDRSIGISHREITQLLDNEHIIGCAKEQTHAFLNQELAPALKKYAHLQDQMPDIVI